jgi:hypothetical protein
MTKKNDRKPLKSELKHKNFFKGAVGSVLISLWGGRLGGVSQKEDI